MDALALHLIHRAPFYLVMLALAFLVGGALNTISGYSTWASATGNNGVTFAYLWGALFGIFYQPAIMLGWASAIYYLSRIAGRAGA